MALQRCLGTSCNNRAYNGSLKYTLSLPSGWKLSDYVSYAYDDIDYFSTEELSYPYELYGWC